MYVYNFDIIPICDDAHFTRVVHVERRMFKLYTQSMVSSTVLHLTSTGRSQQKYPQRFTPTGECYSGTKTRQDTASWPIGVFLQRRLPVGHQTRLRPPFANVPTSAGCSRPPVSRLQALHTQRHHYRLLISGIVYHQHQRSAVAMRDEIAGKRALIQRNGVRKIIITMLR